MMQPDTIQALITAGLKDAIVHVEGDGRHFTAVVICSLFAGQSRIERQKTVYATVNQQLADGSLHALSLRTFTPDEWEALDTGEN